MVRMGYIKKSPLDRTIKADFGIVPAKPKQTTLTFDKLKQLWHFLDHGHHSISNSMIYFIRLLILRGQRNYELRAELWEEFDFDNMLWTISQERYKTDHKTHRPHLIPLHHS